MSDNTKRILSDKGCASFQPKQWCYYYYYYFCELPEAEGHQQVEWVYRCEDSARGDCGRVESAHAPKM